MSDLPTFRYHPDPIATGSIVEANGEPCQICGDVRTHLYQGPFYALASVAAICPWCIASGRAAEENNGEFTGDCPGCC